jgi:hypothetical protein
MFDLVFLVPLVVLYLVAMAILISLGRPPHLGPNAPRLTRAPDPPGAELRLWIEGTERPLLRSTGFLAAFGLEVRRLRDIRVYEHGGELESFPARLIALLFDLYTRGAVRGADAMALLFHGRPLGEGEALYFALIDLPPEPSVVAFIDRRPVDRNDRPARV